MSTFTPATELVRKNKAHLPNESEAYRRARNDLLVEEIELRRHIEKVAAQRRKLPPGGEVTKNYEFVGENGPVNFADLFKDKQSLIVYSYMFGPQRERPCSMCTSFMNGVALKIKDIEQNAAIVFTARSPIDRLIANNRERGWKNMPVFSDMSGDFTRDYVNKEDADVPGFNVFHKDGKVIRHFWAAEMSDEMTDPGQDPRGAPDMDPLWNLIDSIPEGRNPKWYPKLEY